MKIEQSAHNSVVWRDSGGVGRALPEGVAAVDGHHVEGHVRERAKLRRLPSLDGRVLSISN